MQQNTLTVIVDIISGQLERLKNVLDQIGNDVDKNQILRFKDSPSTHFARFVILPETETFPPRLYFSSMFDGDLSSYVIELVAVFGENINKVWGFCQGYMPLSNSNKADFLRKFKQYLCEHDRPVQFSCVALRGENVTAVLDSRYIREAIDRALDCSKCGPHSVLLGRIMRDFPELGSTISAKIKPDRFIWKVLKNFFEHLLGIQKTERNPNSLMMPQPGLTEIEDRVVQNQMTVIVPIKPNWWSKIILRAVLWQGNRASQRKDALVTKLGTIHFAKWAIIDDGCNLLFESNYDGSWEKYIDDFVDHASFEMNAIWGNCLQYPRGGAGDLESFKRAIRDNQIPAQVFFCAYPRSTLRSIHNNLLLTKAVREFLKNDEVRRFLGGVPN